jgi:hypothetical protein
VAHEVSFSKLETFGPGSPQNEKTGFGAKGCSSSPTPLIDNGTAKYEAVYLQRPISRSIDSAYRRLSIFSASSSYAHTVYAGTCSISRFSVLRRACFDSRSEA